MNIFILDDNPILAARMHCDEHVSKMILESAQMLCTAAVEYYGVRSDIVEYKSTHKNHPCTKWVGESTANFAYVYVLAMELEVIRLRNHKYPHSSARVLDNIYRLVHGYGNTPMKFWDRHTPFVTAIAPQFLDPSITDPVAQYQHYYRVHKPVTMKRGMHWTLNSKPDWMTAA